MYEIFQHGYSQMGAVALLLAFSCIVIKWLRDYLIAKDKKIQEKDDDIKGEISKREQLLREVLEFHRDALVAMKTTSEAIDHDLNDIKETLERIESKTVKK